MKIVLSHVSVFARLFVFWLQTEANTQGTGGGITPSPGTTIAMPIPTGFSLLGSPLAATVANITSAPVSLPLIDGMQVLTWNGAGYVYSVYDSGFGGWVDGNFAAKAAPDYAVGQGFFLFNPGREVVWRQFLP
jgi:hypothetical protein